MLKVGHNRSIDISRLPGVFPNYNAPVIRMAADGEREMVNLNWGLRAAAAGQGAAARHERARQGHDRVLARVHRTAPLPGAGVSLLRAERRRKAGNLEFLCLWSSTNAAACTAPIAEADGQ
jgi:hypothetical protein